jgi:uncharacterized protein (UPF0332 family)
MKHKRKELIRYRLSNAEEKFRSVKILLENGQFRDSILLKASFLLF